MLIITDGNPKEVFKKLTTKGGDFDFNKIKPMPKELNLIDGTITTSAIETYLFKNPEEFTTNLQDKLTKARYYGKHTRLTEEEYNEIIKAQINISKNRNAGDSNDNQIKTEQDFLNLGKQYITNLIEYGHLTWYGWAIENWGTKWNAWETKQPYDSCLTFKTAWSGVPRLIQTASEMFPNHTFIYKFADEDVGYNIGSYVFKGGNTIEELNIENGSREAYELAFEVDPANKKYYIYNEKFDTYEYVEE